MGIGDSSWDSSDESGWNSEKALETLKFCNNKDSEECNKSLTLSLIFKDQIHFLSRYKNSHFGSILAYNKYWIQSFDIPFATNFIENMFAENVSLNYSELVI